MKSTLGRPRKLTDAKVELVLAWHRRVLDFQIRRTQVQTKRQLARELGIDPDTLMRAIARGPNYQPPKAAHRPRGRPPTLRELATLARIHAWYAEDQVLQALETEIGTQYQLADALGVSSSTIARAIRCGGIYKRASPETHDAECARSRERRVHLIERGFI